MNHYYYLVVHVKLIEHHKELLLKFFHENSSVNHKEGIGTIDLSGRNTSESMNQS